jgi:hypothetical protein
MRQILDLTQRELLLVDLDGLTPLLERKDGLIGLLQALEEEAGGTDAGGIAATDAVAREEYTRLAQRVLENEQVLEARMDAERERLRKELRELEQQTRLRGYLDGRRRRGRKLDVTR